MKYRVTLSRGTTFWNSMSQSSSIPPRRHRYGAITRGGDSRYVAATRSRSVSRLCACARVHPRTHARVINNVAETFAARADSAKNRPLTWSPILFPSRCLSLIGGLTATSAGATSRSVTLRKIGRGEKGRAGMQERHRPAAGRCAFDRPCAPSRSENNRFIVSA